MPFDAIVVLGCRVDARGEPLPAARRRIERAARAYAELGEPMVILSGGKRWHGRSEAEVFANVLVRLGVPRERLICEERSLSTRENARESGRIARERGFRELAVVTCDWHLARALSDFERYGFRAQPVAAQAPRHVARARRFSERAQSLWDRALIRFERLGLPLLLLVLAVACQRGAPPGAEAAASARAATAPPDTSQRVRALLEAPAAPKLDSLASEALASSAPELRLAAVRALGRSTDAKAIERLLSGLADESPAVLEASAFALGRVGASRSSAISRALALRAASLVAREPAPEKLDAMLGAMAGALGRLASEEAERTLRAWLALGPAVATASALALGELAARRGRLADESYVALLDGAEREPPLEAALYAFSRVSVPAGALTERLRRLATASLSATSPNRADALRALEHLSAAEPLAKALEDAALFRELGPELARALGRLRDGNGALVKRLQAAPSDPAALLESNELPSWLALLDALKTVPPDARAPLERLSKAEIPAIAWKARRAILLRCGAARALAAKNWNHAALAECDPSGGRIGQLAQLAVLDRDPLVGPRAERFRKLAASSEALVRQAAVRLLSTHPEFDKAAELLGAALADAAPGTIAAAAEVLAQQPERAALRKAGADSPLNEALVKAYRAQANGENPAVLGALIDAAASLQLLSLSADLERTCTSSSAALRERAERALRSLGRLEKSCAERAPSNEPPAELEHLRTRPVSLRFETELGELAITLDPRDAPIAVTRIADLAKAGFYDGTEIHRFVPGFVLQFGDRAGDGYGGAGRPPLRSELGPTLFRAGAVGLAESGLDTGSSQLFVTLGRFPHLDGNSTYLGQAGPGWERLVAYDRILRVRVVE